MRVFAIDGSLVLIWLLMVAMRIAVRSGVVGDCEDNAKPRGAPYSKHAGYEDIPYSYSNTAQFLTAVGRWSAIHGFPNPLEGVYKLQIEAARRLCRKRGNTSRPFRATALSPLQLMVLIESFSPLLGFELQAATIVVLSIALFLRPR